MSVCFYPIHNDKPFSQRNVERFRYINTIKLPIFINKLNIESKIKYILSDFCDASIIGYDRCTDKYWCKIYEGKFCQLHIEVEIFNKGFEISEALIIPLYGTTKSIQNFVSNFKESIELYQSSSFIRGYLDGI